ncbi:MAG TPA: M20 family metallopeptidase [Vicinamibacterales bacterium]|nr:M20 family metallopeptidase [Vicinamibacterales bacterium]
MSSFLHYCRDQHEWLLEFVEALVAIESPSDDPVAVNRCGVELSSRLQAIGGDVTRISPASAGATVEASAKVGDHLRVSFGSGPTQVLLLGHFDTVWPVGQLATMPLKREGGRLYGPGVFDMKAGIGLATLATRALLDATTLDAGRIVMVWTTDEEIGSATSRALIEAEAAKSSAVMVFEPSLPGGALKTSRKGVGQFEMIAKGVSAHAGLDPGKGVSAIRELARQIVAIDDLQDPANGVTLTVGTIAGGTRVNVVPAEARAVVDARAVTRADADRVQKAMRGLKAQIAGASLTVTGGFERPPLERTPGVVKLFEQAKAVAAEIGVTLEEGSAGGGSDGNFTAALGIPTLDGFGAVGDGAHAIHEHVDIDALVPRAATIAGLLARLLRPSS